MLEVDWTRCEIVETPPDTAEAVIRGTKISADSVLNRYDLGESIKEIRESHPMLPSGAISRIIEYANAQRGKRLR